MFYLAMLVMLTNTIEYGEWKTGKNHAAITFTVRPFMVKLAGAIQYGIVAVALIVCGLYTITQKVGDVEVVLGMINEGYITNYAQIVDYLVEQGHELADVVKYLSLSTDLDVLKEGLQSYANSLFVASSASMWGLTAVMCVCPVIMFVIALIVLRKKYIIDEAMYEKITKEIAERNAAKEA